MGKDLALEFESKRKEVLLTIAELEKTGIDVALLKGSLEEIVKKYLKFKEEKKALTFQDALAHYAEGIVSLNEFQDQLRTMYQDYLEIESLLAEIQNENYNPLISSKMIDIIKKLQSSTTLSYELESTLVEKVYDRAYQILKKEIAYGEKALFEYIKENEIARPFTNYKIHEEIEELNKKTNGSYSGKISKGTVDYLDESLLLQLAHDTDPSYKIELKEKMDQLQQDYEDYQNRVSKAYSSLESSKRSLQSRKKIKLYIFKKAFTILAATTVILAADQGFRHLDAKLNPCYYTKQETYSTVTGESEFKSLGYLNMEYSNAEAELIIYKPWLEMDSGNEKEYGQVQYHYRLNMDLEKIEDYLDANLEELGVEPTLVIDTKNTLSSEDLFDEEIKEVIRWHVDFNDAGSSVGNLAIFYVLLSLVILAEEGLSALAGGTPIFIGSFKEIIKHLKALHDTKEEQKKILTMLKKLNILLKENEEFRIRYESLLHQYKNLLRETDSIDFTKVEEQYSVQNLDLPKRLLKGASHNEK